MSVYLFAAPIVGGKTETWKNYMKEITGPRYEAYKESRKKVGLNVEQAFLQQTPQGDVVVVRWETDNPQGVFEYFGKSQDSFDQWFRDKILVECHNMDLSRPAPVNSSILDYQEKPSREYADTKKNR